MNNTEGTTAPVRLIVTADTYNLRDVGGYRAEGGEIRWRTLFRSDALHRLSPESQATLIDIGVGRVIDLRDDLETTVQPDKLPPEISYVHHPIFPSASENVRRGLSVSRLTELIYMQHAPALAEALALLAIDTAPTIVHCTAGKDRTGAVIALALTSVGVDRDDILHDYAQTEQHLAGEWTERHIALLQRLGVPVTDETRSLVSQSPVQVLERALKTVEREFGSIRDYLVLHGLSEANLHRLHERLVS